jgi:hypothetical protein
MADHRQALGYRTQELMAESQPVIGGSGDVWCVSDLS